MCLCVTLIDRAYFEYATRLAKFRSLRSMTMERNTTYRETRCIAISDVTIAVEYLPSTFVPFTHMTCTMHLYSNLRISF